MTTKVEVRATRESGFWSAGRLFHMSPTVLDVVPDDPLPLEFLRPRTGSDGWYAVDVGRLPRDAAASRLRAGTVRPRFVLGSGFIAEVDGRQIPIVAELDLPRVDVAYQAWSTEKREEHIRRNECTTSDLAQFFADRRFLAVRTYDDAQASMQMR